MKRYLAIIPILVCLIAMAAAGPADDALNLALTLKGNGDLQGAVKAAVDGLALAPNDFKLNLFAGDLFYELGQYQESFAAYQKALGEKNKDLDALRGAGRSALKLGRYQDAASYFENGLKKKKSAEFHYWLGTAQMELGNYPEADLNLRKAIDKEAKNASYHLALGEINYRNKVYSITIAEFRKAMELDSEVEKTVTDLHYKLAQSFIQLRNLDDAIVEFRKELELHPKDTTSWLELGNITQLANRYSDAAFCYVKFLEIVPNDGERWFSLGVLYLNLRDQEKAAESFEKAVSLKAREAESYGYLASIYSDRKEFEKAWDAYNRFEGVFGTPDSVLYWFDKGKVAIKLGSRDIAFFDTALACFKRSADLDFSFSAAYEYAGLSMYYKREYAAAIPYFLKKIELDSSSVNSLRNLAFCYLKLESYDNAAATFEKALVIKPEDTQMRSMLGKIYSYNEKYVSAIKHFEILLNDYSADLTDSLRCVVYPDLGLSYLKQAKCNDAVSVLLKAEQCKSNELSVLFNIASAYQLCNKMKEANDYYKKVLRIDPGNKDAIKGEMMTTKQGED